MTTARDSDSVPDGASVVQISASRVPGRAANVFQIFKMAEALGAVFRNPVLFAARGDDRPQPGEDELRQVYGVSKLPALRLFRAAGRFGIHLFNLRTALAARALKPNLVISRSIGAAAFCARLGLPTIWECHAPPQGFERYYWRWLVRASGFRRLVVISRALADIMADRHPEIGSMDMIVAHDGVDAARFEALPNAETAKRTAGRDLSRPVAAYAGHLYEGRGVGVILACAAALPHWQFLIAGGTPTDQAAVKKQIAAQNLKNVELLGFIDNTALPGALAVADILLMPYQRRVLVAGGALDTAQWMSPLKMFEYLAMGRAILSSDLPVLREVLNDEVAVLLDPDCPDDWVAALRKFDSGQDPSILGASAIRHSKKFDWSERVRIMTSGMVDAA